MVECRNQLHPGHHQWKPVFESLPYRKVKVESKDFKPRKGVVSLPRFRDLVSGKNQYRRSFIQRLGYTVIIPYEFMDYSAVKREGYKDQNPVREANDQAFWSGMKSLFEFLNSWEKGPRFLLAPAVRGQDEALQPSTESRENAHSWEVEFNGDQVVGPYRAGFPRASMLPQVTCLFLNVQGVARPDHLWYMRDGRQGDGSIWTCKTSVHLRVLKFEVSSEHPWSNTLPALDLRPDNSKIDEFSTSLGLFSCYLREQTLSAISVDMDLFYPLDDNGSPTPEASSPSFYWPYLESIIMTATMFVREWLLDFELDTGDEEDFPDPAAGDEIFESRWLRGEYEIVRDVMNAEHFHRLFISLGYAARRMPRLKTISFDVCLDPITEFEFGSGGGGCTAATLTFESQSGYTPDMRVAEAWGFSLDQLVVERDFPNRYGDFALSTVGLDKFPVKE
ncbi:hypothetical protein BDV19DRAFT_397011 [Aspergillus venezuelensis]